MSSALLVPEAGGFKPIPKLIARLVKKKIK